MRAVVQRVTSASVEVSGEVVGAIGMGLCVLVGATHDDTEPVARKLAAKLVGLRIFEDDAGAMNRSLTDVDGAVLVISQFTLYGDAAKGRRPSFLAAAPRPVAEPLVEAVVAELRSLGVEVATGRFGEDMAVQLVNDGPTTILLEL
jgi:D-tyrosyl-tRNA(Tyr) deacylase